MERSEEANRLHREVEDRATPFRSHRGREEIRAYWVEATADQSDIDVATVVIAVAVSRGLVALVSDRLEDGSRVVTDGDCILSLETVPFWRSESGGTATGSRSHRSASEFRSTPPQLQTC